MRTPAEERIAPASGSILPAQAKDRPGLHALLLDSVRESVIASDLDGRVLYWGQGAEKLYGYKAEEALGKPCRDLVGDIDAPDEEALRKLFVAKGSWHGERVRRRKDGSTFWASISLSPITGETGLPAGFIGIDADITDRKTAAEALRLSEEKFKTAFQASPHPIFITCAADGRFLDVNNAFTAITGFSKSEALARSSLDLGFWVHPEDRLLLIGALKPGLPGTGLEFPFRTKSGGIFIGLVSSQMIQLGSESCLVSSVADITEQKKTEEKLRASAERFSDIASNIPGVIYQLRNGRTGSLEVPYMSSGCEALFERPLAALDFTGLLFNHMHIGDRALFEHSLAAATAGLERWSLEFRIATPDGKTKWLRGSANPRRLPDGRILWNGVLLDISEQKQAEDARRESEERFRLLVKNSSDVLVVIDAAGTFKYISPAEETLSGFSDVELTGKTIRDAIHPDDLEQTLLAFREVIAHPDKIHRIECRHLHKTNGWVHVEIVGQSFLDEAAVKGVVVNVRDVTGRRQAEEQMTRQMDELRRWYSATLGREDRIAELKKEVNALASILGRPPPYAAPEIFSEKAR